MIVKVKLIRIRRQYSDEYLVQTQESDLDYSNTIYSNRNSILARSYYLMLIANMKRMTKLYRMTKEGGAPYGEYTDFELIAELGDIYEVYNTK